jgi:hypothetical protein
MGNRWRRGEGEKGMGRKRGGGQYTANQGSECHGAKEGFQVGKKGIQEQG